MASTNLLTFLLLYLLFKVCASCVVTKMKTKTNDYKNLDNVVDDDMMNNKD